MAIIKAVRSGASLKRTIDYVSRQNKLDNFLMDGIDCNAQTASFEMLYIRDKFDKHEGVQCIHLVYSLSPDEAAKVGLERVMDNARKLAENTPNFKGHQILICGHDDKIHKHAHIVVNAVNYQTGQKVRWYKYDLNKFKNRLIEQSKEQGLTIPVKGQTNSIGGQSMEVQKVLEKAVHENYSSWLLNVYAKVNDAQNNAVNKDDFINILKKDRIETMWNNRKTILFIDEAGNKVRDTRLSEVFKADISKETLENEFKRNAELLIGKRELERPLHQGTREEQAINTTEQTNNTRERRIEYGEFKTFISNARDEIVNARTAERNSTKERNDKIVERKNRDAVRGRQYFGGEQRPQKENGLCRGRSCKEDFSR